LCFCYFGDGVSQTIRLDWPRTSILPVSVSQVARITGVSPGAWPGVYFFIRKECGGPWNKASSACT
jgi:hypothetical protein